MTTKKYKEMDEIWGIYIPERDNKRMGVKALQISKETKKYISLSAGPHANGPPEILVDTLRIPDEKRRVGWSRQFYDSWDSDVIYNSLSECHANLSAVAIVHLEKAMALLRYMDTIKYDPPMSVEEQWHAHTLEQEKKRAEKEAQ